MYFIQVESSGGETVCFIQAMFSELSSVQEVRLCTLSRQRAQRLEQCSGGETVYFIQQRAQQLEQFSGGETVYFIQVMLYGFVEKLHP